MKRLTALLLACSLVATAGCADEETAEFLLADAGATAECYAGVLQPFQPTFFGVTITAQGYMLRMESAVRARTVVMACGGYIAGLHPNLSRAIVPVATYVAVTEPLGERLQSAIRVPYAIADTRFALDYYRPLDDTRILWGGRVTVRRDDPPGLAELMRGDLLKVYPQLRGVRMETAWSGLMSFAVHQMPQVGEVTPGVWYGMGFGGHGMNTTTMAGELVASAIAEGDDRYRLFAPFGLIPTGGPLGAAAVQLTYWYYALWDSIKS